MNQLNETLRAIRTTKATLYKQLQNTTDKHIQQKIEHQIHCLSKEETETLNQLNFRLDDIELTEEEEDDNQ